MSSGFLFWNKEFAIREPYIDGHQILHGFQNLDWTTGEGLILIPTHAGTHIAQRFALGTADTRTRISFVFTATLQGAEEEDYFRIARAVAKGSLVTFVPFVWTEEVIDATSGSDYTLSRPVAWGLIPSCTSALYPATFFLNDVEDAAAASLSGQTLSALKTGQIAVRYMPAFRVKVSAGGTIPEVNDLQIPLTLSEGVVLS